MIQGLRTVVYPVSDAKIAKEFYTKLTNCQPYFDEPFYIGYNVGGYELGLDPNKPSPTMAAGPVTYWGVPNIEAAMKEVISIGAKEHHAVQDVGGGIKVAEVLDPFGNVVGLIENPHFKLPD